MEDMAMELTMQSSSFLYKVFMEMPCGAALHKIVCDESGKAVDYFVTEVNNQFLSMMNIKPETVIGVRASERMPSEELQHWLDILGPVALEEKTSTYTMYSPSKRKTFYSTAICPQRGCFFVMFAVDG